MKKILFLAIVAILFGCTDDRDINPPKPFSIKATDMISIRPASGVKLKVKSQLDSTIVDTVHLSALEIVKKTTIIQYNFNNVKWERVFESNQRDTISNTPCLKMYGLDIINQEGNYVPDFIEATNCILIKFDLHAPYGAPRDTLAYIPNATLRAAEILIKQAYEAKDIELVIKTFNEAFTFIPITGAEYKALKAKNLQ